MPNWCYNYLSAEGSEDEISKLKLQLNRPFTKVHDQWNPETSKMEMKEYSYSNPVFAFHNIYNHKQDGISDEIYNSQADHSVPLQEQLMFAGNNWYDWNVRNWGTKWDVDADDIDFERVDGQVHASFDTAWGPPLAFYRSLEEDHGYKVIGYYIESGQDFCGIYEDGDYEHYDIDENVPDRLDEVFNIKDMLADREDEGF